MKKIIIRNNIKECVQEYTKRTGVKLNFIADKIGMSQQAFTNQYYAKNPSVANVARYAWALGLAMHEVVNIQMYDENGNEIIYDFHTDTKEKERKEKLRMIQKKLNNKRIKKKQK